MKRNHSICISVAFIGLSLAGSSPAQDLRVVEEPTTEKSAKAITSGAPVRNPFATASGPTNQRLRLARQALNNTKVLGIAHTDLGKIAVIQTNTSKPPLILSLETTFSLSTASGQWIEVQIQEITEFEVKVAPVGGDGNIILR